MLFRRHAATLVLALIAGFAGGALSLWLARPHTSHAQDNHVREIKSNRFTLIDENGKTRAELTLHNPWTLGPGLVLYDSDGNVRGEYSLWAAPDGNTENESPLLAFRDSDGDFRARVFVDEDDSTILLTERNAVVSMSAGTTRPIAELPGVRLRESVPKTQYAYVNTKVFGSAARLDKSVELSADGPSVKLFLGLRPAASMTVLGRTGAIHLSNTGDEERPRKPIWSAP